MRYFVLFVIDLKSRRVEIAGIVHQPHDAWMKQAARNLNDVVDGFLRCVVPEPPDINRVHLRARES